MIRTDPDIDGRQLFGFKAHGLAAMRKIFVPGDIVMPAFMTVYLLWHFLNTITHRPFALLIRAAENAEFLYLF